jgi:hypothetical protein
LGLLDIIAAVGATKIQLLAARATKLHLHTEESYEFFYNKLGT